jgi:hypothetical protein
MGVKKSGISCCIKNKYKLALMTKFSQKVWTKNGLMKKIQVPKRSFLATLFSSQF